MGSFHRNEEPAQKVILSESASASIESIGLCLVDFLENFIPEVQLIRTSGKEVTLRLPKGSENMFPGALQALDLNRKLLGIGAFGIENSSLEEVFLLLAEDRDAFTLKGEATRSTGDEENVSIEQERQAPSFLALERACETLPWRHQLFLLYCKRLTIQKRDLKGLVFSVVVPALLVALALLILTVHLNIAGSAIEMSPSTLDLKESGVVVGGGAALFSRRTAKKEIAAQYDHLSLLLEDHNANLRFEHEVAISNSSEMSDYLLATYNDGNHSTRYGAFILQDLINLTVSIDWEFYRSDIEEFFNKTLENIGTSEVNVTDEAFERAFYDVTGLTLSLKYKAVSQLLQRDGCSLDRLTDSPA
jgi:hypothetical protein